jgi:bis(5'-nucleosyl)-tetraphosphatase (symmetrical)
MRKRIFIGDVHGCADELDDLLNALDYRPKRHALWFAGDVANRGPQALRAMRRVREVATGLVLGNHDLHLLGVAAGNRELRAEDTLAEVLEAPDRDELLDWLRGWPLVAEWDDVTLVHAGLHPDWKRPREIAAPLERRIGKGAIPWTDDALTFLTRVRLCDAKGNLPRGRRDDPSLRPWFDFYRGSRTVVWGHWAARGLVTAPRLRGLDSGCVWGGSLSAWIADEDRIVSVPARRTYVEPDPQST